MSSRPPPAFLPGQCVGLDESALSLLGEGPLRCHRHALVPWQRLVRAAARDGLALAAVSAYRGFDAQLAIWNAKWRGERPVLDRAGRAVDMRRLSAAGRMEAILVWSALPGASRHHWGTEFDVVDRAALPPGYQVRLVPAEYSPGGPFEHLGGWLDRQLHRHGFHRPYRRDRGGVAPEPWHLSCTAVASEASRRFRLAHLRAALATAPMEGREVVLARLPALYERFVRRVDRPR